MSGERYTDEFKIEAVRQVTDRDYTRLSRCRSAGCDDAQPVCVAEEVQPKQAKDQELDEAQRELRRDILKKAATYFAKEPG